MSIYTNTNSAFPSQVVSDAEKASLEYGTQVGQAIEYEWFGQGRTNGNRYLTSWNQFHQLRLYARGEQSIQKYKDELSINGDLSYLNLDWKPVPILSKFVDIVVNGISSKSYDIKAYAQDPQSIKKRTDYASMLYEDMVAKEYLDSLKQALADSGKVQIKGYEDFLIDLLSETTANDTIYLANLVTESNSKDVPLTFQYTALKNDKFSIALSTGYQQAYF
mgnify:CR=1 FL=1